MLNLCLVAFSTTMTGCASKHPARWSEDGWQRDITNTQLSDVEIVTYYDHFAHK